VARIGHGIAGSPVAVRNYLTRLQSETGVNTVLCQMVFGDMRFEHAAHPLGYSADTLFRYSHSGSAAVWNTSSRGDTTPVQCRVLNHDRTNV
jgi:hypothetical protein